MRASGRDRAISAGMVILLHALACWLLLDTRTAEKMPASTTSLATFDITPPLPAPSPPVPPRLAPSTAQADRATRRARRAGRSGVEAVRNAVAAPIPVIVPPSTLPAPATPQEGAAFTGGAAATGGGASAGRSGTGSGGGGAGDGDGAGGGRPARWLSGTIGPRDYPKAERSARIGGTATVAFTVDADGHARGCAIVESSGSLALDSATCRLVEARFRYAPARDAAGAPISERRGWRQRWWIERD